MTAIAPTAASFYVTGGTLDQDAPSYVERQADRDLLQALLQGEYCYVLNSRQMGKSSLCVRSMARLRQAGVRTAFLDLTKFGGRNLTAEQWYAALLAELGRELGLRAECLRYWKEHLDLPPVQRLFAAITEVALPNVMRDASYVMREGTEDGDAPVPSRITHHASRIVLFIDEIDVTRSLPFNTDEFFAAIRQCYVGRTTEPALQQVTFCLLGTATPAELIEDTRVSPFNIGRRIEVRDFTAEEAAPLAYGLVPGSAGVPPASATEQTNPARHAGETPALPGTDARRLLQRILYWTGGHPYLTQRLCRAVAEAGSVTPSPRHPITPSVVDRLCAALFLTHTAKEGDDNLALVRNRLLKSEADLASLLELYGKLRAGQGVADDETNGLCGLLKLSGLARVERGRLAVRNRIYARVFDREWVKQHMPDAEVRRQRAAYQRGVLRASATAAAVVVVMAGLALSAVSQARRADFNRAQADRNASATHLAELRLEKALATQEQTSQRLARALQTATAASAAARRATDQALQAGAGERAQRHEAERQRGEAVQQKGIAEAKRAESEAQRELSRQRLVRLNIANGMRLVDEGDLYDALLFLAKAQKLDQKTPARQAVYRMRLAAAIQQCPKLSQMWFHHGIVNCAAWSPDGRFVVTAGDDGTAVVRDVTSGRTVGRPLRHGESIRDAAFSPDGRRVVTASADHTARIWDASTGRPVGSPLKHSAAVNQAAFSPDGRRVVTASDDQTARVWDAETGTPATPPLQHRAAVTHAAFSPDGRRIVTAADRMIQAPSGTVAGTEGEARIWDAATGAPLSPSLRHNSQGGNAAVNDAEFSPDGRFVATVGNEPMVRIWNGTTGAPVRQWNDANWTFGVSFSPDSRHLVTACADGTARVWDVGTGDPVTSPLKHVGEVHDASFSPDGRSVVAASNLGTAQVWDAATGAPITPPLGHGGNVVHATFSPDGRRIATASVDGAARVWELAVSASPTPPLRQFGITQVAFSPDGRRVATAGGDGTAEVWNPATGSVLRLEHQGAVHMVSFSRDGRRVVTASSDKTARVWDALTGKEVTPPLVHREAVLFAAFRPDGRRVVTASLDQTAQVWDAATGKRVGPPMKHRDVVRSAVFSPDGRRVLTASDDHTARLWDAVTGRSLGAPLRHAAPAREARFSPDGRRVVTASFDRTARVWDAATGRPVGRPMGHNGAVLHASFSPDGRHVLTASADATARVWDAATGEPLTPPMRHDHQVVDAKISPDGHYVVTASWDNTARVWDAATGEPVTPSLKHPTRVLSASFSPDGRQIVTASGGRARVWDLPHDPRPLPDPERFAQLMAAHQLDATEGIVPVDAPSLRLAWNVLRRKDPEAFAPATAQVLAWHRRQVEANQQARRWNLLISHLEPLIAAAPGDGQLRSRRATAYAEMGEWEKATADFKKAIALGADAPSGPQSYAWSNALLTQLGAGDTDGYRRDCARRLERFANTKDPGIANETAWSCVLAPDAVPDLSRVVQLAQRALKARPNDPGIVNTLGVALYRAGRFEEAIRRLNESVALQAQDSDFYDWIFLAMAHSRLGHTTEARQWLEKAVRAIEPDAQQRDDPAYRPWSGRLAAQLLRREAEALIQPSRP